MIEWKPIETAPKTPDEVIAAYGDRFEWRILIGRGDEPTENPHAVIAGCVAVAMLVDGEWLALNDNEIAEDYGRYSEVVGATHWALMPAPPKENK